MKSCMINSRRALGILAGIVIFIGITHFLDKVYVPCPVDSTNDDIWYCALWQQFYENEGKIDNLYLGSSHVYCDINPKILDQLTGKCNFNLASPIQPLNGSYYLLREADKKNKLSHVYLEMYYDCNQNDKRVSEYYRNWKNTDSMRWSFNKAAYMVSIGGAEQYINILFPYTRYRKYLGEWDFFKENYNENKKLDEDSIQWEMVRQDGNGQMVIQEKGFRASTRTFEDEDKYYHQNMIMGESSMGEQSEKYCRRIIEYCQKKEIPITLFVSPINDLQLISTQDYDEYIEEVRRLAAEYDCTFYDFNLVKEEYLPLQDSKKFRDAGHMNQDGAKLFTPFFYQVVSGKEPDNKKYFYNSYQEKLESLAPAVYGAYYSDPYEETAEGEKIRSRTVWVASNRNSGMEYRIILTPDEGEQYTVQDFVENKEFQISLEEHGICTIVARMKDFPDEVVQTMEIRY